MGLEAEAATCSKAHRRAISTAHARGDMQLAPWLEQAGAGNPVHIVSVKINRARRRFLFLLFSLTVGTVSPPASNLPPPQLRNPIHMSHNLAASMRSFQIRSPCLTSLEQATRHLLPRGGHQRHRLPLRRGQPTTELLPPFLFHVLYSP